MSPPSKTGNRFKQEVDLLKGPNSVSHRKNTEVSFLWLTCPPYDDFFSSRLIFSLILSALGVPDSYFETCRRISTEIGPLFRGGGFYSSDLPPSILVQVGYYQGWENWWFLLKKSKNHFFYLNQTFFYLNQFIWFFQKCPSGRGFLQILTLNQFYEYHSCFCIELISRF